MIRAAQRAAVVNEFTAAVAPLEAIDKVLTKCIGWLRAAAVRMMCLVLQCKQENPPQIPEGPTSRRLLHQYACHDMHMPMRTTVDIPDALLERARPLLAARQMTLKALVVDALERLVGTEVPSFKLRDASVGNARGADNEVSNDEVYRAVDELNERAR